jgi:hypothetical protein
MMLLTLEKTLGVAVLYVCLLMAFLGQYPNFDPLIQPFWFPGMNTFKLFYGTRSAVTPMAREFIMLVLNGTKSKESCDH